MSTNNNPSNIVFTQAENDLIVLGVSFITRGNTTINFSSYGDSAYRLSVIQNRLANSSLGSLDIATLFTANSAYLKSAHPSLFNAYTIVNNNNTITLQTQYIQ